MTTLFLFNSVILAYVAIYGIAFGIRNFFMSMYCLITRKELLISESGKMLQAIFYVAIAYFVFFQSGYILLLLEMVA